MEKSAVAYFTNGTIIVAAVARTTSGLSLEIEPQPLGRHAKVANIADAIGRSLDRSVDVPAEPTETEVRRAFIPFQDAAGVKNFKTFMRDARRVDIEQAGSTVMLTPNRNLGANNGFEAIEAEATALAADDQHAVARDVLRLLGVR